MITCNYLKIIHVRVFLRRNISPIARLFLFFTNRKRVNKGTKGERARLMLNIRKATYSRAALVFTKHAMQRRVSSHARRPSILTIDGEIALARNGVVKIVHTHDSLIRRGLRAIHFAKMFALAKRAHA